MNFSKTLNTTILYLTCLLLISCDIINPEEDIPAYIRIDTILLETDQSSEGTNTHNITDIWVNINNKRIGTFEIPVTFPVLANGECRLTVKPGIKANGIAASREVYPFYAYYEIDTIFIEEQIIELIPVFRYKDDTNFDDWMEDFENSSISLEISELSDTTIEIINDPDDPDNGIGAIFLDNEHAFFECIKSEPIDVIWNNSKIYLELDYENNNEFYIGLIISVYNQPYPDNQRVYTFNKMAKRNKIYLNLTNYIRAQPNAINYSIFIGAVKEDNVENATIYLDNLKLIRF